MMSSRAFPPKFPPDSPQIPPNFPEKMLKTVIQIALKTFHKDLPNLRVFQNKASNAKEGK